MGPLGHRLLEILVDRGQELLRGLELLSPADEQRQVFGHLAALDRLDADLLEGRGELRHLGRLVHPPAGGEATGPGEDRGDRVGRGRFALPGAGGSGG